MEFNITISDEVKDKMKKLTKTENPMMRAMRQRIGKMKGFEKEI